LVSGFRVVKVVASRRRVAANDPGLTAECAILKIGIEMSAKTTTEIRDAIRSVFRGKPVKQVDLFGSAAAEKLLLIVT
jgi:hypothetical protein